MSDDVMDLLESIEKSDSKVKPKKNRKPKAKDANSDILGFLDEIAKEGESRPQTPKKADQPTPAPNSSSDSNESKSSAGQSAAKDGSDASKATAEGEEMAVMPDPIASISSWWSRNKGGIWDSATSAASNAANRAQDALKQAEARVKELQNEPQSFNMSQIQDRVTSVLRSIVPPIGQHEQLTVHIFHDLVGYPNIEAIVLSIFERTMDQVEGGGDLNMIALKGKERHKAQAGLEQRSLNLLRDSVANGAKLARANVEEYQKSPITKGVTSGDKDTDKTTDDTSESEPSKKDPSHVSEIFVSIQPVLTPGDSPASPGDILDKSTLQFVVYLADPTNNIQLTTVSQAFPKEWADWLDAPEEKYANLSVDPRIWALEWIEDGIGLSVGVLAQKYVTRRMGISKE